MKKILNIFLTLCFSFGIGYFISAHQIIVIPHLEEDKLIECIKLVHKNGFK